jgi:hypothetical protein
MTPRLNPSVAAAVVLASAVTSAVAFELDERTNEVVFRSLAGFDRCVLDLSETPACLDALRRYASKRLNDSFQAGKRARLHYEHWTALAFFEIAFRKQATDAQCGDEDVLLAVISGLSQPESAQATVDLAKDIAANKCWEEIKDGLIEATKESSSAFLFNACALMKSKEVTVAACPPLPEQAIAEPSEPRPPPR